MKRLMLLFVIMLSLIVVGCSTNAAVVDKKEEEVKVESKADVKKSVKKDEEPKKKKEKDKKKDKKKSLKESKANGSYMATTDLTVRDKPGLKTNKVGILQKNKKVEITKKTEEDKDGIVWYKFKLDKKDVWASSKYMTKYKEVSKKEVKSESTSKNTSKKKSSNNKKAATQSASGDLMSTKVINVYNSAGGSSVGKLNPHQKIVATQKANVNSQEWLNVKFKNQSFWVKSNEVVKFDSSKVASAAPKKQSSNTNSNGNSGGKTEKASTSSHNYQPNRIYYNGRSVHYQNVGTAGVQNGDGKTGSAQNVIDSTGSAATFGGAATFSGTDGQNTHFIGHNGKQFVGMQNAGTFVVTDSSGRAFEYKKTARYIVNENGSRADNGQAMYNRIAGSGGGERITLQTTEVHPRKWIVEAAFSREIK